MKKKYAGSLYAFAIVAAYAAFVFAAVAWPWVLREVAAKEGPIEHLSHAVLVVAVIGWARAAWRHHARRGAVLSALMAVFCTLVLFEELSWGKEVGVDIVADHVRAIAGRPDFHNAWGGASYMLFAVPLLVLILPALARHTTWLQSLRSAWGDRLPTRRRLVPLGLIAVFTILGTVAAPAWENELDELNELMLYLWLTTTALAPPEKT